MGSKVMKLGVMAVVGALACSGSNDTTPTQTPGAQVGTVAGLVADGTGAGVPGASLSLSATGRTSLGATSGSDGRFQISQVPAGAWTLSVTPPTGFSVASQGTQAVTVAAGQTASANFTLNKDQVQPPPQTGGSTVAIAGFAFSPQSITVTAGSSITWTNNDNTTHTVSGDKAEFDSGNMGNKATFTQSFPTRGTFAYHCAIHPTMTGTVVVQ